MRAASMIPLLLHPPCAPAKLTDEQAEFDLTAYSSHRRMETEMGFAREDARRVSLRRFRQ